MCSQLGNAIKLRNFFQFLIAIKGQLNNATPPHDFSRGWAFGYREHEFIHVKNRAKAQKWVKLLAI